MHGIYVGESVIDIDIFHSHVYELESYLGDALMVIVTSETNGYICRLAYENIEEFSKDWIIFTV